MIRVLMPAPLRQVAVLASIATLMLLSAAWYSSAAAEQPQSSLPPGCPGDFAPLAKNVDEVASLLGNFSKQSSPIPKVARLAHNTIKIFACVHLVNYYAELNKQAYRLIGAPTEQTIDKRVVYSFGYAAAPNICGTIVYDNVGNINLPQDVTRRYKELEHRIGDVFFYEFTASLMVLGRQIGANFVPTSDPQKERLAALVLAEIAHLNASVLHNEFITQSLAQPHSHEPRALVDLSLLTSTGCGVPLPTATAPEVSELKDEPDAQDDYSRLVDWLATVFAPASTTK